MPVLNKTDIVTLRVAAPRKRAYMEAAEAEGERLSTWLRALADRRVAELARQRLRALACTDGPEAA
jgi:hypothetical protein